MGRCLVLAAASLATTIACGADRVEEVVVTGTRTQQQLRDFAGSISLVSSDDVALVGSTHHSEIMNRAPGAMIQRNSGQESLTAIRSPVLSGPGSCGVFLFLENSVPIRPTGFCNVNELFEVNSEQARSIEVLRGPAGVVYGSGAMHGAINVIQAAPAELPRQSLALEGGPDEFYRGKLGLAHTGGDTDFGGVVVATHDGGWRDRFRTGRTEIEPVGVAAPGRCDARPASRSDQSRSGDRGLHPRLRRVSRRNHRELQRQPGSVSRRVRGAADRRVRAAAQRACSCRCVPYARHSRMDFLQHFLIGKPLEENGQESLGVLTALQIVVLDDTRSSPASISSSPTAS